MGTLIIGGLVGLLIFSIWLVNLIPTTALAWIGASCLVGSIMVAAIAAIHAHFREDDPDETGINV